MGPLVTASARPFHATELPSRGSPIKPPLDISTVEVDRALCIAPRGELDLYTAPLLEEALRAAEATGAMTIVLDIDAVSFIDSSGLRTLLEAHARSQRDGDRLRITRGTAQAQRLFALVAAGTRLPFVERD